MVRNVSWQRFHQSTSAWPAGRVGSPARQGNHKHGYLCKPPALVASENRGAGSDRPQKPGLQASRKHHQKQCRQKRSCMFGYHVRPMRVSPLDHALEHGRRRNVAHRLCHRPLLLSHCRNSLNCLIRMLRVRHHSVVMLEQVHTCIHELLLLPLEFRTIRFSPACRGGWCNTRARGGWCNRALRNGCSERW